jgi:hypothetical protein
MTIEIVSVAAHPNTEKNWRHVTIRRDGEQARAICFDGQQADTLKPGPLPEHWTIREGQFGPVLSPPRKPGAPGGFRYRDTEDAVRLEQDRLDARMAAQLACRAAGFDRAVADAILAWIREAAR